MNDSIYLKLHLKNAMFKKKNETRKSYGIAITRFNVKTKKYEILFIKKRYTYAYVEFVLGHYSKNNEERLKSLFSGMSHEEKVMILSLDFGKIWYKIWLVDPESLYFRKLTMDEQNRYYNCKKHFEKTFLMDSGDKLRSLINQSKNIDTIWEIPKGRKQPNESLLECSVREVEEETGVNSEQYHILHEVEPRVLKHTDVHTYENTYLVAVWDNISKIPSQPFKIDPVLNQEFWHKRKYKMDTDVKLNFKNDHQIAEVIAIKWLSLDLVRIMAPMYVDIVTSVIKILRKKKIGGLSLLRGF
jgi:8-oxo-dGTP pyrophosphatase MutT (NUDIX family)